MEENTQENSQTPTQTPLVRYNDMHTPGFQPYHPILPMTPVFYIPHPNFTQFSSPQTNIPIPFHLAATPEHRPSPQIQSQLEAGDELSFYLFQMFVYRLMRSLS